MGTARRTSNKTSHGNERNTAPVAGWPNLPLPVAPTVSSQVVGAR